MSANFYEEAIADAKQLKRMAEENAKNRLIEHVTPRLRQLIEKQLLGDDDDEEVDIEVMDDEDAAPAELDLDAALSDPDMGSVDSMMGSPSIDAPADDLGMDAGMGDFMGDEAEGLDDDDGSSVKIDAQTVNINMTESSDILASVIAERGLSQKIFNASKKVKMFESVMRRLKKKRLTESQKKLIYKKFEEILKESIKLHKSAIITDKRYGSKKLHENTKTLLKEIEEMPKRSNSFKWLFEMKDDEEKLDEFDVIFDDSDLETLGLDPEQDAEKISGLDALVSLGGAEEGDDEMDYDMGDDEGGSDEGGDEDLDFDMDDMGGDEEEEMEEADIQYEIDEATLRAELTRLRENAPTDGCGDTSFGGGKAGKEAFVDGSDSDLNGNVDKLGDAPRPRGPGKKVHEAYVKTRAHNRKLAKSLKEHKRALASFKKQLVEMNLFNAKLLYVNKLMQNKNVTLKQQKTIVEALDNAKTLREAKVLYTSLSTALVKKGSKRNRLNESARPRGSSSVSTRSGSPAKNEVVVDRWATLAGISK
jgi:hypothetical protein